MPLPLDDPPVLKLPRTDRGNAPAIAHANLPSLNVKMRPSNQVTLSPWTGPSGS